MKLFRKTLISVLMMGLALAACTTPPTEMMSAAEDAVLRAENDADAVSYAGGTLLRAREALGLMRTEADAKRYEAARNYASEASAAAEKAIADGKTGAARAREEAAALVNSLGSPLAETAAALGTARDIPGIALDYEALSADVDEARRSYDDARKSLADNNYGETVIKCQRVRSLLADVNGKIFSAVQEVGRKQ